MKTQFLFISMATATMFFVSCRKESIELPATNQTSVPQSNAASATIENNITINPLLIKLVGWYRFDGNMFDATGKLSPGVPIAQGPGYTSDRKGVLNSALKLEGNTYIQLFGVPQQTASSISVWVKTFDINQNHGIVSGPTQGMSIFQNPGNHVGGLTLVSPNGWSISSAVPKNIADLNWHHIAVTYDGSSFKFYVDAVLAGSSNIPGSITSAFATYIVGNGFWKGAIDELRFYSRALTAADVTGLYKL